MIIREESYQNTLGAIAQKFHINNCQSHRHRYCFTVNIIVIYFQRQKFELIIYCVNVRLTQHRLLSGLSRY